MGYIVKQKEERSGYAANKDRKNLVAVWNWGMKCMKPPLPRQSTTERYLRRIVLERVREVLEDLSRSKKGDVVEFKHWPQKTALPGLQE
jgi:hypothetical protein